MKLLAILLAFAFILETFAGSTTGLLFFGHTSDVHIKVTYDTRELKNKSRDITVPIEYFVGKPLERRKRSNIFVKYEIKCITDRLMEKEILPRINPNGDNGCEIKSVVIVGVTARNGKYHNKYIDMSSEFSEYINS